MANYTRIGTAALRQIPFDFKGNVSRILTAIERGLDAHINILLMPELALTGYGCEDNFSYQEFNQAAEAALNDVLAGYQSLAHEREHAGNMLIAMGMPVMFPGGQVYNTTAFISADGLHGFACKQYLARNGLHYEPRWFEAWPRGRVVNHPTFNVPFGDVVVNAGGLRIGVETCEDAWVANRPGRDLYHRNVDVLLNPSASHFAVGKNFIREQFIKEGSRAFGVVYAYANLAGTENGTSIFDGGSLIASEGKIVSRGDRFNVRDVVMNQTLVNVSANRVSRVISSETIDIDDTNVVDVELSLTLPNDAVLAARSNDRVDSAKDELPVFWDALSGDDYAFTEICYALGNGLWDWTTRTHTDGYVVSLSGGADSALVAASVYVSHFVALEQLGVHDYLATLPKGLAAKIDAIAPGEDKIVWLKEKAMPKVLMCLYQGTDNSSETTFNAAKYLAEEIGATFHSWNIEPVVQQYHSLVNGLYPDRPLSWKTDDIAMQNIQARSRSPGVWMLANRENKLLIATSNLSESALGYATMDGDTSGVISVIAGINKTTIRKVNRWLEEVGLPLSVDGKSARHQLKEMHRVNVQQPTAELRPEEQTDEADLMPYVVCDFIMDCYLARQMWPKSILVELMLNGFDKEHDMRQLAAYVERWFRLFCRNPWKRYGTRAGFHIEQVSLDPKTFHRFPLLNNGFSEQLQQMWDYVEEVEG